MFAGVNNGLEATELQAALSGMSVRWEVVSMMPQDPSRKDYLSVWLDGSELWDLTPLCARLPPPVKCRYNFQFNCGNEKERPLPDQAYEDFSTWVNKEGLDHPAEINLNEETRQSVLSQWPGPEFLKNAKVTLTTGITIQSDQSHRDSEEEHLFISSEIGSVILAVGYPESKSLLLRDPLLRLIPLIRDPEWNREKLIASIDQDRGGYFFTDPDNPTDHLTCPDFVDALGGLIKSFAQAQHPLTYSVCAHLTISHKIRSSETK